MKLQKLALQDKKLIERFLGLAPHALCTYSFPNIYIWKDLYQIHWGVIKDSLCIFFKDSLGSFLYLPPLSKRPHPEAARDCFEIMDDFNTNKEISRIENVEAKELALYQDWGYTYRPKFGDYLYLKQDLIDLKGNRFKSKRSSYNFFIKSYDFQYLPYSRVYQKECLRLFDQWKEARKSINQDPFYQGMLQDSYACFKRLLEDYASLDILGRIVKIDKNIRGFTCGCRLSKDIFCVLYEITDLSTKGLSQFIFRKFSQELESYKYVNAMDDSGLINLKKAKLSYRPERLIPAYIVSRRK